MSPNQTRIADLNMSSSCVPNRVAAAGSQHRVELHNTGYDTYLQLGLVVGVHLASTGCSIRLARNGVQAFLFPAIQLGCLPSGETTRSDMNVVRIPTGTTVRETIRTTVEFASNFETDPLDDDPVTPHTCMTEVNVSV